MWNPMSRDILPIWAKKGKIVNTRLQPEDLIDKFAMTAEKEGQIDGSLLNKIR